VTPATAPARACPVVTGEPRLACDSRLQFSARARATGRRPACASGDLLVVVASRQDLDSVTAAARRVKETGGRVLVAVARPRPPFTTDPVVARHAARRREVEDLRRRGGATRLLEGTGVQYQFLPLCYRDSGSGSRRRRRITAAARRLAREHAADMLWATRPTMGGDGGRLGGPECPRLQIPVQALTSSTVSVLVQPTARLTGEPNAASGGAVAVVLPDSLESVLLARAAAARATALGQPLVLIVPVAVPAHAHTVGELQWRSAPGDDAAAVAGRVDPVLSRSRVRTLMLPAPYRADADGQVLRRMAEAIQDAARQGRAACMVISADCPALDHFAEPSPCLHVVDVSQASLQSATSEPYGQR